MKAAAARKLGEAWATVGDATVDELRRLSDFNDVEANWHPDETSDLSLAERVAHAVQDDPSDDSEWMPELAAAFWQEQAMSEDGELPDDESVKAFCLGAMSVYAKAEREGLIGDD